MGRFTTSTSPAPGSGGTINVKYAYLTPIGSINQVIKERHLDQGTVEFHRARWEDMPTQYNIVNALCDLRIRECRGASVVRSVGGKDLSNQRVLRSIPVIQHNSRDANRQTMW